MSTMAGRKSSKQAFADPTDVIHSRCRGEAKKKRPKSTKAELKVIDLEDETRDPTPHPPTPGLPDNRVDTPDKENKAPSRPGSRVSMMKTPSRPPSTRLERPHSRAFSRNSVASSKKTINRSAKKTRSRPQSQSTLLEDNQSHAFMESESEDEVIPVSRATGILDIMDFGGPDIYNDQGWDTDLEIEEEKTTYDGSGKAIYMESCKNNDVIPMSYFIRHMDDSTLELKHHGLGPSGVKPICVALVSNTRVTKLSLADNWLGRAGGLHVCDMLKENCYIYDIDLSDNGLSVEFAQKFIDVLKQNNTLTHITLAGNDFDDASAVFIGEAIMNTTRVEYLDLSRNKFGDLGGVILGPAISENSSIKHLDLSWNAIRRKGAVSIANGLKTNVLMQKVNLSWNGFCKDGAKALGDALKVNSSLEEIDIGNNRITTEGAVLLGKGLAVNESLKKLKMDKNPMQSAGCYGICAAVTRNPGSLMQELDFSDIQTDGDFHGCFAKLKEAYPDIKVKHGPAGIAKKPKARVHPMVKLKNYIDRNNLRLVDFFNKFDTDNSMSVTREEFAQGIEAIGIKLTEAEVEFLLEDLDEDGDGEINYSEMVMGHQDFTEKEKKMATTIMEMKTKEGVWK